MIYYKAPTYKPKTKTLNQRDKKIQEAMERKEKSIAKFVDQKSVGIAVSSAFNNASQICVALLNTGKLDEKDFWKKHEQIYKEYLERFAKEQVNGALLYKRFVDTAEDIKQKEIDAVEHDLDNEVIEID